MLNRKDYRDSLTAKKPEKDITSLEIKRSAPQMRILTNSEEWNKYLSYLEPLAENAEKAAKELSVRILSPDLFDVEKLVLMKSEYIRMTERAEVIRELMTFPKQIIELGEVKS